jgi:hypothetical protein
MSRDRNISWMCGLWLPLAVALVWWPVLCGGRTIARSELATTHHPEAVEARVGWPVCDSLASARQDECWLVLIRRSLAEGCLPLVNPDNGLGAPLLESLQPGVLYPPNVLLLAFDPASPWMFDAFCLIHVLVLVTGLAVLFRRDTDPQTASALAILFGLAGATYQNVNMVHFRGFVWLPWMLACVQEVAGAGGAVRWRAIAGLIGVTFCSLTAGNLQDAFVSLLVTGCVGGVELFVGAGAEGARSWSARVPPVSRWLRLVVLMSGLGTLGTPVVLPYLIGVANGDLATVASSNRVTEGVPLRWMSTWLVPHVMGAFPHQLLERNFWYLPQPDFPTAAVWLVVFALLPGGAVTGHDNRFRARAYGLLAGLALLKTCDTPLFDWLAHVPVVGGLKFHKYNLFVTVLLGSVAAMGLEGARQSEDGHRQRALRGSLIVVAVLVTGLLLWLWRDRSWGLAHATNPGIKWFVLTSLGVSILTTLATAAIVGWGGDRRGLRLAVLWTVHSQLLMPGGWLPRVDRYEDPVELADTQAAGSNPERLAVTPLSPNSNLLFDRAELGVFDPVLNRRYRAFHLRHFEARYADFALHQESAPRSDQQPALKIAGVTDIARFAEDARSEDGSLSPRSLSRDGEPWSAPVWIIPDEDVAARETWVKNPTERVAERPSPGAREDQGAMSVERVSPNVHEYALRLPPCAGKGWRLVFRRAYSHAWQARVWLEPASSEDEARTKTFDPVVEPFGDLFCSVSIPGSMLSQGQARVRVRLSYWPQGLTTGLWLLPVGVALVVLAATGLQDSVRWSSIPLPHSERDGLEAHRTMSTSAAMIAGLVLGGTVWLSGRLRPTELDVRVDPPQPPSGELAPSASGTEWSARLETIDGYRASGNVTVVRADGSQRPVVLRGWIVHEPTRSTPREVRVRIGNRWWNATMGLIREDRPPAYADSRYRLCGFLAPLPPEAIPNEPTPVQLWVRLDSKSAWVAIEIDAAVRRAKEVSRP